MDLGGWLRSLGLERYEAVFRDNEIDADVLHDLTDNHLREMGVALGARLKLLKAIAALSPRAEPASRTPAVALASLAVDAAERRQVTVMFSDLVGSTSLSVRMDPEDLREVISAYQKCVAETVHRFDGFVARYMGDGVLVYFGYPHAHEDDAERAIRTGMTIIDAVAQLSTIAGPPGTLSTRIGIATGVVVVGDLIGSGSSLETVAVGDTPNLAARLQAAADPGKVVISDSTRLLTGDLFEYRELVLSNLKGRPAPERAWIVVCESMIDSRFEALRRGRLALVGRLEELELLLRRWEKAGTGEGRVVLLAGEPGMGKSHLVAALEQKVNVGPNLCLRFLCSPHHHDTPLYPVIRHIERAANLERGDSPATKWEKLTRLLGSSASEEDIAVLADLLSIAHSVAQLPKTISPQHLKAMTFVAIIRLIDNLTRQTTVLAIVEDMHWADPTTLDLLGRLIERVPRLAMLLVATTRPEVQPPWSDRPHVAWRRSRPGTHPARQYRHCAVWNGHARRAWWHCRRQRIAHRRTSVARKSAGGCRGHARSKHVRRASPEERPHPAVSGGRVDRCRDRSSGGCSHRLPGSAAAAGAHGAGARGAPRLRSASHDLLERDTPV